VLAFAVASRSEAPLPTQASGHVSPPFIPGVEVSAAPESTGEDDQRLEILVGEDALAARALIEALGGTVELESGGRLQVRIPSSEGRHALAASLGAGRMQEPVLGVPLQASELSRSLLGVDRWRDAGFTGYGVKLAVLDGGFRGYESRLGRTLPSQVVARSFRVGNGPESGTDHGTLAAEVAYSIAPGARLYLVSFGTLTELSAAVDYLLEEQVDVVSFSLGFLHSGPGDGGGPVDEIVGRGASAGAVWAVAAGNWAQEHWQGPYVDANADSIHEFAVGLTGNGRYFQAGDLISVSLRWDDAWGSACSDFDLELFAPSGSLVRASRRIQSCAGDPVEGFQVLATETGSYIARIVGAEVRAEHTLDLLLVGSPDRGESLDFVSALGSLSEPADNARVLTVGALGGGSPLGAAPFSSRGPTADGRAKPEVLSPTGGAFPSGSAFAGTSAAAPHVAGVLALLREGLPGLGPRELTRELLLRSIDLGRGTPGAPEVLAGLGSVNGLGPLLPAGAAQARFIGSPPRGSGLSLLVYLGPSGYPTRFAHLLEPGRTTLAYFRFDEATQTFDRYIVGAPSQVQTFTTLSSGTAYVVRFGDP
jgi:subtilisin family serine protease